MNTQDRIKCANGIAINFFYKILFSRIKSLKQISNLGKLLRERLLILMYYCGFELKAFTMFFANFLWSLDFLSEKLTIFGNQKFSSNGAETHTDGN